MYVHTRTHARTHARTRTHTHTHTHAHTHTHTDLQVGNVGHDTSYLVTPVHCSRNREQCEQGNAKPSRQSHFKQSHTFHHHTLSHIHTQHTYSLCHRYIHTVCNISAYCTFGSAWEYTHKKLTDMERKAKSKCVNTAIYNVCKLSADYSQTKHL